jgi:hexosaminidase
MKEHSLKDEHELQSYFIQRMEKYLNQKGRTLIGWDEILEGGLAPNALVMSWRGEEGGIAAAKENHDVVMTPGGWVYLDHSQTQNEDSVTIGGYTPVEKTYSYEPVPASLNAEQAKHILGAQGNLWTEYITNPRKVEYMIFPRMSALSEVLWSPKEKRNWEDFEKRLPGHFKRYDFWKANYSRAYFDIKSRIEKRPDRDGLVWILSSKHPAPIEVTTEKGEPVINLPAPEGKIIPVDGNVTLRASLTENKKALSTISQRFQFNKATGKNITISMQPSPRYPGNGAITLVNGVQNDKGLSRSIEFLGFEGPDCEAIIDLGSSQSISNVIVHSLNSGGSWVYPPKYVEVHVSNDGQSYTPAGKTDKFEATNGMNGLMKVAFNPASARYVRVIIKNFGVIPSGMSGAGNRAWLFVDEIEVN